MLRNNWVPDQLGISRMFGQMSNSVDSHFNHEQDEGERVTAIRDIFGCRKMV